MRLTLIGIGPLLALLAPKCPFCLIAWLGLGAGALPWLQELVPIAIIAWALLLLATLRSRRRGKRECCN